MTQWIHFQAPGGHVISMTWPLHESIEHQWEHGELKRVTRDGALCPDDAPLDDDTAEPVEDEGDEQDADGGEDSGLGDDPDGEPGEPGEGPARPKPAAKLADWQAYAVELGAASLEEVASLTKAQLVELTTPPEMLPAVPEV